MVSRGMKPTEPKYWVGQYDGVIEYMKDISRAEEKRITKRLWELVAEMDSYAPGVLSIVEDDIAYEVPDDCSHYDALAASVTRRYFANDPRYPI